ncbi:succinate dehydrogenase subunit [Tasmannia lanceolata]|uniref:succinate dehydrogenase subunit n=1 Tax=Tasmannia lanceolata TaxID=3420 RepID=UPI004063A5E0
MGEDSDASSDGNYWKNWREYWATRFSILDSYKHIILAREKPLPKWSDSDVEDFINSDPTHGPPLKAARKAAEISATGSAIGAVSTAGLAWKYSKSPHGAALAFGAGAIFGWTFGQEIAGHWLQLYRMDTMAAQLQFFDWWEKKCQGK